MQHKWWHLDTYIHQKASRELLWHAIQGIQALMLYQSGFQREPTKDFLFLYKIFKAMYVKAIIMSQTFYYEINDTRAIKIHHPQCQG